MKIDLPKASYSDDELRALPAYKKLRNSLEHLEEQEILKNLRKNITVQRDKLLAIKRGKEQAARAAKAEKEQAALSKKLHKEAERFVARLHKLGLEGHNFSVLSGWDANAGENYSVRAVASGQHHFPRKAKKAPGGFQPTKSGRGSKKRPGDKHVCYPSKNKCGTCGGTGERRKVVKTA